MPTTKMEGWKDVYKDSCLVEQNAKVKIVIPGLVQGGLEED